MTLRWSRLSSSLLSVHHDGGTSHVRTEYDTNRHDVCTLRLNVTAGPALDDDTMEMLEDDVIADDNRPYLQPEFKEAA